MAKTYTRDGIDKLTAELGLVREKITAAIDEREDALRAAGRRALLGESDAEPRKRAETMDALRTSLEAQAAKLEAEIVRAEAAVKAQEALALAAAWSGPAKSFESAAVKAAEAFRQLVETARALSWPAEPRGNLDNAVRSFDEAPVLLELMFPGEVWRSELAFWARTQRTLDAAVRLAARIPAAPDAAARSAEESAVKAEGGLL